MKQFYAGLLRNGTLVCYRILREQESYGPYMMMGWSDDMPDHHYELWKANGSWAEDGKPHPFDLVQELGPVETPANV